MILVVGSIKKIVGSNIRRLRRDRGWSQAHLAELAGVDIGTIQRWERGERWPEASNVEELCRVFRVMYSTLYRTTNEQGPSFTPIDALVTISRALGIDPRRPLVPKHHKR